MIPDTRLMFKLSSVKELNLQELILLFHNNPLDHLLHVTFVESLDEKNIFNKITSSCQCSQSTNFERDFIPGNDTKLLLPRSAQKISPIVHEQTLEELEDTTKITFFFPF
jgi:hypothetical protein